MYKSSFTYCPKKTTLRFRRWSRKSYAAFVSLHHSVTMGCLATHIAERLNEKHNSLHSSSAVNTDRCSDICIENASDEEEMMQNVNIFGVTKLCETLVLCPNADIAASGKIERQYIHKYIL